MCVCSYWKVFWFPFSIPGTGSGIGTKVLETLQDDYPEVYKYVNNMYPDWPLVDLLVAS